MPDWLRNFGGEWGKRGADITPLEFAILLAASALAAIAAARLYVRFYAHRASGSDVHRAFPLLGIAITAIFVCIQFSLPLSLGLLGALSIVRFRTPIKEPEEIGFLMIVISTSLACATGRLVFVAVVLAMAVVALLVQEWARPIFLAGADSGVVVASFSAGRWSEEREEFFSLLRQAAKRGALEAVAAQEERVTVTWRFRGLPPESAAALERRLAERLRPESLSIVYTGNAGP
jgi:hypothetical protein